MPFNDNVAVVLSKIHYKYQLYPHIPRHMTDIRRLKSRSFFCAKTRWRRHVLNGFLRQSRPSISMTTDASLNARRLGAIDRPLASPYSTSEIPDLSVTTTIYRRLLNVDPEVPELRCWRLCCHDNGFAEVPLRFLVHANYFVCRGRLMPQTSCCEFITNLITAIPVRRGMCLSIYLSYELI